MNDAANTVADIAAEQWGIITTAQARAHDVTAVQMKRLTDRGALERVHHGIYTMTRIPYDPLQGIRVAWIALDPKTPVWDRLTQDFPSGVVSHRTAAKLHLLGDIDADWTEFTCNRRIRIDLLDIKIHTGTVEVKDWTTVEGLPVTTARRTVDDLAAAKIDGGHLASIARSAISQELATVDDLEKTLARHAFAYGHLLNDGNGFLASLVEEAGVSVNTLRLADFANRRNPEYTKPVGGNDDNTLRRIDLDRAALAFAGGETVSELEKFLRTVSEKIVRDALTGVAAAQLDAITEAIRAAVSVSPPSAALSGTEAPARDIANTALSRALAPISQTLDEGVKAHFRGVEENDSHTSDDVDSGHKTENFPESQTTPGDNS